ncbi:MAG: M28 family peptidase [Planctomycetes bacterium]|nr:M28 family peptidase [Planctomycetota bacterium]
MPLSTILTASFLGLAPLASPAHEPETAEAPAAPAQAPATTPAPPARALLRELAAQPRLAGTIGSKVGAEIVAKHLAAAGWTVELDERAVLLSYPRAIEFVARASRDAKDELAHRIERFDPDAIPPGDVPKYNAWSKSADVTGEVVDAGFGTRADFERLKTLGVDLAGKVALVRYGRCYRGIKVDLAARYGCAAVLLFTESAVDGAAKGPTWPAGPWKPGTDAQRGSILPIEHTPGDPSTPGWGSPRPGDANARRIDGAELDGALPRIPCLPIGALEAEALQAQLATVRVKAKETKDGVERDVEKDERLGPGPAIARVAVDAPRELRTIVNVIATLPGKSERFVLAGAHRDAWVRGANDDGAGVVSLLRAAQRLGERSKAGWRPENTPKLAFWDAEEFGLLGSTEWGEANADRVRALGLAYLNADVGVHGTRFSGASGTPGMLARLAPVLERIPSAPRADGSTPANLWEEWKLALNAKRDASKPEVLPSLGLPGSGSDFAVFVHHLSIPSLELGFGGASSGQYHTAFDDFELVERYIDPGFVAHELLGQLFAELLGDLGDAGPLVLDPVEAARALADVATRERDAAKDDAALAGALHGASNALRQLAEALAAPLPRRADLVDLGDGPRWKATPEFRFYRALERADGLPGRAWFKNVLWAPGLEDGYGSESFPTLRAAAKEGAAALQAELERLQSAIAGATPP